MRDLTGFLRDLRIAWRHVLRSPGFSAVVIATLALGIGANSAIFTVAKGVLLDPLPYEQPDRLMVIMEANPGKGFPRFSVSPPNWVDFHAQSKSFASMAAQMRASLSLTGEEMQPERLSGTMVTGEFFEVYGTAPIMGRYLTAEDDCLDAEKVAVLGFGFWQRRFGGEDIIDRMVRLSGENYRVVGVMPEGFQRQMDIFVPLAMDYAETGRGAHYLRVRGRLADGVSLESARAELVTIAAQLEEAYPDSNTGWTTVIEPLHELMVEDFRAIVFLLFGAVGLVLLIACANVANLFLVRLADREREVALRSALGAGRGQLIRQWLMETVSMSLVGGGLGVLLGIQGTRMLVAMAAEDIPRAHEISVDGGVLAFSFGLALLTGVLLGLLPALNGVMPNLSSALKEGGRGQAGGRRGRRIRLVLVLAEVAIAVLLLIGAGLLVRSLNRLVEVDPGFDMSNAITAQLSLPEAKYPDEEAQSEFYHRLYERLAALPGVEAVAAVMPMPLTGGSFVLSFYIAGTEIPGANEFPFSNIRVVNQDYFGTMGIPLLRGRTFSAQDAIDAPKVAVVNKSTAEKYWPGQDALGQRITFGDPEGEDSDWLTVVGVVADVHHEALSTATEPEVYWVDLQSPMDHTTLVLRTVGDPSSVTGAMRAELAALDPNLPLYNLQTLEEIVQGSLAQPRFNSMLVGLFAGLALLLASLGVYGVISYTVSQGIREIGVRLALGAGRFGVMMLVLSRGLSLVCGGIGIGLVAGFFGSRLLSSMIYEVSPTDVLTFAAAAGVLALAGLFACWWPAQRAMSVDPAVILRDE